MRLRKKLEGSLKGWKDDLPPAWRPLFKDFELDFTRVGAALNFDAGDPLFPGRRGKPPAGAPPGSHLFHALDGIAPRQVRLVVVGQDPYPNVAHATGRSFEQGDLEDYASKKVTASMRRLLQVLAEARTGNSAYVRQGGWPLLKPELGEMKVEGPRALWDGWRSQGAIFLNVGLTITKFKSGGAPEQKKGHIPLWQPFVRQLLRSLAGIRPFVFVTWGAYAKSLAKDVGDWGPRVLPVDALHPAAGIKFLAAPNQFLEISKALGKLGGPAFRW